MRFDAFGHRVHEERHCRWCDRELLDWRGRQLATIFSDPPEIVYDARLEPFDDGKSYVTEYVFCDDECQRFWSSWE